MCYYLNIAVSENKTHCLENGVPPGLTLTRVSNASLKKYVASEFCWYVLTLDMCSCGLFRKEPNERDRAQQVKRLYRKYRRKGWPTARIERAVSQAMPEGGKPSAQYGIKDDARIFLSDAADASGELFILVHWYDDDVEKEEIKAQIGPIVPSYRLRTSNPVKRTDKIYRITKK